MAHEDVSGAGIEIMRKRNDVYIAIYRCSCCGSEVTVPRQKGRKRGVDTLRIYGVHTARRRGSL